jgi:hypothetical protein
MNDILDRAFNLPLRRALPDLAAFGLVPDPAYKDRGRASWVAIADGRKEPTSKPTAEAIYVAVKESEATLNAYLHGQLAHLRAAYPAVVPVRLYLRGPGAALGHWTRAWMGLPDDDLSQHGQSRYLQRLLEALSKRPELAGHEIRGRRSLKPDRPQQKSPPPTEWLQRHAPGRGPKKANPQNCAEV